MSAVKPSFVRFLAVGLLNTLFGYGCYALFLFLGLHYAVALFLATVVGVLFNFRTTGQIVFRSNNDRLVFRFAAVYAIVYALNVAGLKALALAGMNEYIAGALLMFPAAFLAFVLHRRYVFQ